MNNELTDTCPMPLGKHKGIPMEDVPAEYLVWYRNESRHKDPRVMEYIKDNWQGLLQETKK